MPDQTVNVLFCGVGGQGVLLASDLFSLVIIHKGLDIKKAEIKGMSQRGGSVVSQVRFGGKVFSPVVEEGTADYLVTFNAEEGQRSAFHLRNKDHIFEVSPEEYHQLKNKKCLNTMLLAKFLRTFAAPGALDGYPDFCISREEFIQTVKDHVPSRFLEDNLAALEIVWPADV